MLSAPPSSSLGLLSSLPSLCNLATFGAAFGREAVVVCRLTGPPVNLLLCEDEARNLVRNPLDSLFTQTESQRAGDPLVVRRRLSELLPYPLPPLPPAPLSGVQKKFSPSSSDPL